MFISCFTTKQVPPVLTEAEEIEKARRQEIERRLDVHDRNRAQQRANKKKMENDARRNRESEKAEEESKNLNALYRRFYVLKWGG